MGKLFVLLAVVFLGGCAGMPKPQHFNPEKNQHLKHITIIEPAQQEEVPVRIQTHAGQSFGLLGALIAEADMASDTSTFNEAVGETMPDWQQAIVTALKASLEKEGYQVSSIITDRKRENGYLVSYKDLVDQNTDAILDLNYYLAYLAAGMESDFIPNLIGQVRLIDTQNKAVVFQNRFFFGFPPSEYDIEADHILSDKQYAYNTIELLAASPEQAIDGLEEGVQKFAEKVAQKLAKQPNAQVEQIVE
ncbi:MULTISPECIES: hypothetical protein [Motilimonas]|uniref:Lipoprotein n=1 Tax=Motilimonas cestriensis TaxID=2742685 RepID=A0ABS8WGY7_9GAMM|nr:MULTISPECIES: hypothetical protein [Motilimonas]MCE0558883.1 hypothetical protein [Motilimonas sp. E26]MCE2596869.1 hypothetical protein [Motilimonas cestriensis]